MVLGMPNVGKSTLLNQLRNVGMKKGSSRFSSRLFPRFLFELDEHEAEAEPSLLSFLWLLAKHFNTSTKPGETKKLTGPLKIHENPTILVHDAPGTMPPWLGKGDEAADKALRIALTSE